MLIYGKTAFEESIYSLNRVSMRKTFTSFAIALKDHLSSVMISLFNYLKYP